MDGYLSHCHGNAEERSGEIGVKSTDSRTNLKRYRITASAGSPAPRPQWSTQALISFGFDMGTGLFTMKLNYHVKLC